MANNEEITTKKVWQFGRTGGTYVGEFPINSIIKPPYTEITPLEGLFPNGEQITLDDQIFNTAKQEWQLIKATVDADKLETVQALLDVQTEKNKELEQSLTDSQEALAEVYETILGGN
ncbi:hypothetical protein LMK05_05815 [Lactococcus petauri]|nr:hypothetical protein LMK05_05815 [Lactococcus petauri]